MSKQAKRHMGQKVYSTEGVDSINVDTAGNVGIGTTSPGVRLHLNGATNTSTGILVQNQGTNSVFIGNEATCLGTGTSNNAAIGSYSNPLLFINTGVERMRLDTSGKLIIAGGSSSANSHSISGGLDIQGSTTNIITYRPTSVTADYLVWYRSDVGGTAATKWRVEADGDTISVTGSYTSDERAKKNFEPIKYGLKEVLQLQPKSFNWWHEEDNEVKSFCVSTAQEVQAIMPEMVRDDGLDGPDGEKMKAIYDKEIVAVLVKAIQEQQEIISKQASAIEKLEARLAALEAK